MNKDRYPICINPDITLTLDVYLPEKSNHAAVLFLYGGGWIENNKPRFFRFATDLAERGYTVFLPEYRTYSPYETTPRTAMLDTIAALRQCGTLLDHYSILSDRIFIGGASAGGQLALAACTIPWIFDEVGISYAGAIAFNPVTDMMSFAPRYQASTGRPLDSTGICPTRDGTQFDTPVLILHGTADTVVEYATATAFCERYSNGGGNCQLISYSGRGHAFHHPTVDEGDYQTTLEQVCDFMQAAVARA